MQGRKDHTKDDQRCDKAVDEPGRGVEAEVLEHHRGEFHRQDRGIEHHAPSHLEHHGVRVPVHDGMPDAPWLAQIQQQGHDHEGVPKEPGQDGWSNDGLKLLEVEEVDDGGQRERTGSQTHTTEQIEADPKAPRELIAQVRDSAQALGVADYSDRAEGEEEDGGDRGPETRTEALWGECRRDVHHRSSRPFAWLPALATCSRRAVIQWIPYRKTAQTPTKSGMLESTCQVRMAGGSAGRLDFNPSLSKGTLEISITEV